MSDNHVVSTAHACPTHRMEKTFSFVATTVIRWLTIVLVLRFHYCKQPMNFGSGGSSELRVSPGHSSRKRHRNAYTQKPFTHTCFKIQTTINMVKYLEGYLPWYPQTWENHFCAKNNQMCLWNATRGRKDGKRHISGF